MFESPFLGTEGRTSTSCNHLANLAKEYYINLEKFIKNNSFVTQTVKAVGQSDSTRLVLGAKEVTTLETAIKEIGQCKALIAYLREGIKAKDDLLSKIKYHILPEQYEHEKNRPVRQATISNDDVISTWPLEKRVRYYRLEAFAATYGKYIHPDGEIAKQRDTFINALSGQSKLQDRAGHVLVYTDTPTIDKQTVEDFFFNLQSKYREFQAELNSLKTEIDNEVLNHNIKVDSEYEAAYKAWQNESAALGNKLVLLQKEETKRVSKLKIIIPENLESIIKKIEAL